MFTIIALLAMQTSAQAEALARRVGADSELKGRIEQGMKPLLQCSRSAIEHYIAGKGEQALDKDGKTLSEAIVHAGGECVTNDRVAEVSGQIRSAMPDADKASADAVARSMLLTYAAYAIMSDGD